MMDAILLEMLREIPKQMAQAAPVVWEFVKANPLLTTIVVGALMIGGPTHARMCLSIEKLTTSITEKLTTPSLATSAVS